MNVPGYTENVAWIENELIPSLVAEGKLTFGAAAHPAVVRNVDIARISIEESTMLTMCYRVKVQLSAAADGADAECKNIDTSLVNLIVKVIWPVYHETLDFVNLKFKIVFICLNNRLADDTEYRQRNV